MFFKTGCIIISIVCLQVEIHVRKMHQVDDVEERRADHQLNAARRAALVALECHGQSRRSERVGPWHCGRYDLPRCE